MLLGADGVDYDLAGVVGARRPGHKILRAAIVQAGDRITWKSPRINLVLAAFLNSEFPSLIQNHQIWESACNRPSYGGLC